MCDPDKWHKLADDLLAQLNEMRRERDEARAELESLKRNDDAHNKVDAAFDKALATIFGGHT